jgi:hypothetical protein
MLSPRHPCRGGFRFRSYPVWSRQVDDLDMPLLLKRIKGCRSKVGASGLSKTSIPESTEIFTKKVQEASRNGRAKLLSGNSGILDFGRVQLSRKHSSPATSRKVHNQASILHWAGSGLEILFLRFRDKYHIRVDTSGWGI